MSFDEISFLMEPSVGTMVIQITGFTLVIIIGFYPSIVEIGNVVVGVAQSRFFMKVASWIKTKPQIDGRQWPLVQTQQAKFFYIVSWPSREY
jgi:hypothetical protein